MLRRFLKSRIRDIRLTGTHLGKVGDRVMVLTYALLYEEEIQGHEPIVLCVNPEGGE